MNKNTKILFINSVCGIGSTGKIVELLYRHFTDIGCKCKIAYGRNNYDKIPKDDQFCFFNKINISIHGGLSRIFDNAGLNYSKRVTKKLIKFIDEFKPDIVNLHNLHGYYLNVPMLLNYLAEKNIKCVFTLHDCWLFTGHCSHFYYNECCGYSSGCKNCKFKNVYPRSIIFSRASKNLSIKNNLIQNIKNKLFISPSLWLKNFARKSFLKNEKINIVYNGIDYNVFNVDAKNYYSKSKLPAEKYIICISNYWKEEKGLNKILELSKQLNNYKIVIIGYLPPKTNLNNNIIHIPHTNNAKELAFYYANAELFYNPTLEDVFGMVTLEALACGIPVLLFKGCSGSEEFITNFNGRIINKNASVEETINAINDICNNLKNNLQINLPSKNDFYLGYENAFNNLLNNGENI